MKINTFFLLIFGTLLLLGSSSPNHAQTPADTASTSASDALDRWKSLPIEKRRSLVRIHTALQHLSEQQRSQLIQRLRELSPREAPKVIRKLHQFLKSSDAAQKVVRQKRTALRLWDIELSTADRKLFRQGSAAEKMAIIDDEIKLRIPRILATLPPLERQRIEQLPAREQRLELMRRKNHRLSSLSPAAHRVLDLARDLDRVQMERFIESGELDGSHPHLQTVVQQLSSQMKQRIQRMLRKGMERRQQRMGRHRLRRRPPQGAEERRLPPGAGERRPPPGAGERRTPPGAGKRRHPGQIDGPERHKGRSPRLSPVSTLEAQRRSQQDLGALDHNT